MSTRKEKRAPRILKEARALRRRLGLHEPLPFPPSARGPAPAQSPLAVIGGRGAFDPEEGTRKRPRAGEEGGEGEDLAGLFSDLPAMPSPVDVHRSGALTPGEIQHELNVLSEALLPRDGLLPPLHERWAEGRQLVEFEFHLEANIARHARAFKSLLEGGGARGGLALDPALRARLYARWLAQPVHDVDGAPLPGSVLNAAAVDALRVPSPYNARAQRARNRHNRERRTLAGGLSADPLADDSVEWRVAQTDAHDAYLSGERARDPPTLPSTWYYDYLATVAYNAWQRVVTHGHARLYGLMAYHLRTRRGVPAAALAGRTGGGLRYASYVERYLRAVPREMRERLVAAFRAMLRSAAGPRGPAAAPALPDMLRDDMMALANRLAAVGVYDLAGGLRQIWLAYAQSREGRPLVVAPLQSYHHHLEGAFEPLDYGPAVGGVATFFQYRSIEVLRLATFARTPLPGDLAAFHPPGINYASTVSLRVMGEGVAMENESSPVLLVDPPSTMDPESTAHYEIAGGGVVPSPRYSEAWSFAPWGGRVTLHLYNVRIEEAGSGFWSAVWHAMGGLDEAELRARARARETVVRGGERRVRRLGAPPPGDPPVARHAHRGRTVVLSPAGPTTTDALLSRMRRVFHPKNYPAGPDSGYGTFLALLDPVEGATFYRALPTPEGLFYRGGGGE